jgi:4-amino-4-deoxy-L-arabinose transferase-like glycosyltransferase
VLLVALAFVTIARNCLGPGGSLAGALIWMANFGMVEKGRLIEIEALYVSLTGLAFVCWMSWWQERRSPWLTWIGPWVVLGLAMLAKGPVHLFFFYAVVVAVLYCAKDLRALWHPAHFAGIAIMLAIFAAWAIPCLAMMSEANVGRTWSRQFSGRLSGEDFNFGGWIMNIPRGLGYFLPWTLLLPFAARRSVVRSRNIEHPTSNIQHRTGEAAGDTSMFGVRCSMFDVERGLFSGMTLSFLAVSLLPGSLPRYTMPLLAPAAWLVAVLLRDRAAQFPRWVRAQRLPLIISVAFAVGIAVYAFALMPRLQLRSKVRSIAVQINAALPSREPLFALDPEYQPALFYVRDPIVYIATADELPGSARWVLVQPQQESAVAARSGARAVLRLTDYRNKELVLYELPSTAAAP